MSNIHIYYFLGLLKLKGPFPRLSLLKVENFQLQNFFPTENLCRTITFYKIFFLRKIFLNGNETHVE
jgi:hypothetical protein